MTLVYCSKMPKMLSPEVIKKIDVFSSWRIKKVTINNKEFEVLENKFVDVLEYLGSVNNNLLYDNIRGDDSNDVIYICNVCKYVGCCCNRNVLVRIPSGEIVLFFNRFDGKIKQIFEHKYIHCFCSIDEDNTDIISEKYSINNTTKIYNAVWNDKKSRIEMMSTDCILKSNKVVKLKCCSTENPVYYMI